MLEVCDYDDPGDGPARAVVAKTTRARQIRKAKETQQELYRIKERVTQTLDAYDLGEKLTAINDAEVERIAHAYIRQQATLEFVDDLMQLMVILSDPLAKRKYQQQVTVFIVGFENLCGRREKLLVQLHEFFNQTGKEEVEIEPVGFDLEVISQEVQDALDKAQQTTSRLLGMSQDVVHAIKMANPKEAKKRKKKLEKALQQSQQDILSLTEKLLKVQNELDENEKKLNQVYKSVEVKQVEIDRLKIQAENGKKNAEQVENLKAELLMKEDQLSQSKQEITELELSVAHLEDKRERDRERQKRIREENEKTKDLYDDNLREQQHHVEDIRLELQEEYDAKVRKLVSQHKKEILTLENKYKLERNRTTSQPEITKKKLEESSHSANKSSATLSFSPDSNFVSRDPSVFSPDSSEGEISSGRASLKSSAKQIRMMLAKKSESNLSSSSCSRTAKTASPPDKAASRKPSQGSAARDKPRARQSSKLESAKQKPKEEQDAAEAVVTKMDECVETDRVELVDVAVQSESDEHSDSQQKPESRRSSDTAETMTESKTVQSDHQESIDVNAVPDDILMGKFKEYEEKAMDIQAKLEIKLMKWKNKYHTETRALQQELDEMATQHQKDKEMMDKQLLESIQAKELAEQDAEDALLQLEEFIAEQEERGITDDREVNSLQQPDLRESMSRHSAISHQSSERRVSEPSLHGDSLGIARDSGIDVGSSAVNDSRPLSHTSHVNLLSPPLEVDESAASIPSVPTQTLARKSQERPKRGISARAKARLINAALNEHPFVNEIFQTYDAFTNFKTGVIQWLEGQGMVNEVGSLENIKTLQLNKGGKAQILESMPKIRSNVTELLEKIGTILSNKKVQKPLHRKQSEDKMPGIGAVNIISSQRPVVKHFPKKEVVRSDTGKEATSSYVKLLKDYNDLAESYEQMRQHMDEEAKFNQEQTSQNAAIMAEMQESINELKAQLAESRSRRSVSSERTNSIIMFSRLDAERNSKILKRAANEDRLSLDNLSEAMIHMESYVSLPAKRLAYISRRYQHHCAMKHIEENLKKSTYLDKNVFGVLDRMEELQNQRARRWGDKMDDLASERERLAYLLTDTFDMLEQDTGIFLIKPVLSYKGRENDVGGYVVSKHRSPTIRPVADKRGPTTPAPSPWLGRASKSSLARATSSIPAVSEIDDSAIPMDVSKAAAASQGYAYQGHTWQVGRSQVQNTPPTTASLSAAVTTSRLQEIDVNRMIIGQNLISCNVGAAESKTDVLGVNARSYVAIERPFGAKQVKKSKRPLTTGNLESPPNTPYYVKTPQGQSSGVSIMQFNPLPPIHVRMPLLRNESRSSKSLRSYSESETAARSVADSSPIGDFRPGTQETAASKDSPVTSESVGSTAT